MVSEHFDVLIVGAGLSGIGAGYHLKTNCPHKTFAILEARDRLGGTWDLFRYPGIRSDSDMLTLGYAFRPWSEAKAIADGPAILRYLHATAAEHHLANTIRFQHRVVGASWSSADNLWTIALERGPERAQLRFTCRFLYLCTGYYDYSEGYTPEFPGREKFHGQIIHPQQWTDDIDYSGKRVVVVGSGATAVTLVPEMARTAAHVTMLQRSPTYVVSLPTEDELAKRLRRFLPNKAVYFLTRWRNVLKTMLFFLACRRRPAHVKKLILKAIQKELGPEYDLRHFSPDYNPWDQRLCLIPDADLFHSIKQGRVTIVTDQIDSFTEKGIKLRSGKELAAELIVTATGLKLLLFGGSQLQVDGQTVIPSRCKVYKGMMLSGVPNLAFAVGYTNASWTLKVDLASRYLCRLLNYLDRKGYTKCVPRVSSTMREMPLIDFSSGYVQRSLALLPKQGTRAPWKLYQNYILDLLTLRFGAVTDCMSFSRGAANGKLK
jgi:cation diffusion facilitator CzcD-associated flavoprotein CzcO